MKSFEINNHSVTIIQHGEKYELRINNQSFSHMMDLERNKNHFGSLSTKNTTSNVSTNNFKLNTAAKPQSFGTGVMNNQNNDKPALFNFAIKPANSNIPNLNRKFGGDNPIVSSSALNKNNIVNNNSINDTKNNNDNLIQGSSQINLIDLSEVSVDNKSNNNYNGNSRVNILEEMNYNNNNNNNTNNSSISQNQNNNNNPLDPFDLINSFANGNNTNSIQNQSINNNINPSNNASNLFGVDITKTNNSDKAQSLIDAMYSQNNNNQNSGFVDFSKQNNQMNVNMNKGYNQGHNNANQYNMPMGVNPMLGYDMTYGNMNPGNNQMYINFLYTFINFK